MSSLSGDESSEIVENQPVRRTRSGRALKTVAPAASKKTPVKKPTTRATRATKTIPEIEEENPIQLDEEDSAVPENGVQQEVGTDDQDNSVIQLQLDATQEQITEEMDENSEVHVSKYEGEKDNEEAQEDENQELQETEPQEEILTEALEEHEIENQEGPVDDQEQENFNQDEQINEYHEENAEIEIFHEQDTLMETENIPEFDPEEVNQEENIMETETEVESEAQAEAEAEDEAEVETVTEFETEAAAELENETEAVDPISADGEQYLNKADVTEDTSEIIDDNMDDQCILIEDDTDQQFELEHLPELANAKNDIENMEENNSQLDNSDDVQEVIEISDHDSEAPSKKNEPDTEAVSEDELLVEGSAKHFNREYEDVEEISEDECFHNETVFKEPETEAVSDEELPAKKPADLGETESVSEDEIPVESEKKRKVNKTPSKAIQKKIKNDSSNKRKRNIEGEYDPSSPTSENNDETPSKKVALTVDDSHEKLDTKPTSPKKKTLPELEKYWKAVNEDPADFTGWTYLLQYVDQENDADAAREAYNKFLERYPYCYGYWRKYADYEKKKGDPNLVQTVFDQGLNAISLSVDLWLHYINHCKIAYEKDEEKMRQQYERAIQACGLEFRSDRLWESYIKWETENKRLNKVMAIYDRLLNTPTLGYMLHFETFQEFVTSNSPNRILSVDDFLALRAEVKAILKSDDANTGADDAPPGEDLPANDSAPSDEETRAIREKIISSRRKMHKSNVNAVAARWTFEEGIKRPYFHVKPLERCQLKNWKEYLDYEIDQKDQTRIVILFERCLIACALYDEFWMRFIRYLESLKGDNTEKIRDVYTRACTVHHPKKPNLHLQWATFEESIGNFEKAASILENMDGTIPNMLQVAYRRINLERRRGDLDKASVLYESYINSSKNRTIANNIVVKYARFLCKVKNDTDKAVKILLKATEKDKDNPRLYLQLIDLGLQRNPIDAQEVIGYMDLFIEREHADAEQRVLFAQRKVEFLEDFSSDIRQVLKAHEQFQRCIKQAKERKKTKNDDLKSDAAPKKAKVDTSSTTQAQAGSQSYQYSSSTTPYQSQQQFQNSQYSSQSGYQQSYQQYPPPSDPNYANYQNWQYSQSGPQAYAPYNQWGSYNYY